MESKFKIAFAALAVACLLIAVGFSAGWLAREKCIQATIANDTIRIERVDTVTLVEPMVDTLIRFVDRLYPVAVRDTIVKGDTLFVQLPYEHRYMAKEDTLEVWYSGIDPKIDSANVYMHHTTEIVKQPYEVARMPRLTLGVGCGAMYADKRVNAYLFGEMRYNARKTTFGTFAAIDQNGRWGVGGEVCWRLTLIE